MLRIGLISDAHGLLRPEALSFLQGCDYIVHSGDIGGLTILEELSALAPISAVRGNNDKGSWADDLHQDDLLHFDNIFLYVIHDLTEPAIEPLAAGIHVVVSGHSHTPRVPYDIDLT